MHHRLKIIASLFAVLVISTACNRDALRGIYPQEGEAVPCGTTIFSWSMKEPEGVRFTLEEQASKAVISDEAVLDQAYTPSLHLRPGTGYTWRLKSGRHHFRADFATLSVLASLGSQVEGTVCRSIYDSNLGTQTTCEPGFLSLNLSANALNAGLISDSLSANTTFSVSDPNALDYTEGDTPHNFASLTIAENYRDLDVTVQSGTLGHATTYTFTNH